MQHILELQNLEKSFGAIKVADQLSYELAPGEALGIIGPNGAGKTTMFDLITGALSPSGGAVIFQGQDITALSAAKRSKSGIARSFQVPQPFSGMSVFENTLVAATSAGGMPIKQANTHCLEVLEQVGLIAKANLKAGKLTLLERKKLELARALAAKPKLLLLDEIAGGLTEQECNSLVATVRNVHATGLSIIWIEHVVHALMKVVDRIVVLDFGNKIADGKPEAVMADPKVREIYMGIEADV
ncbi:ATP-binding cassette domain-containing protein [Alphaproteobacteria bacterium]|nr:ATP-binding cassette domain-containing protein [Alphaproteobacteria bacterium]